MSKTDSKTSPTVPTSAKRIETAPATRSKVLVSLARRPVCRRYLSAMNAASRKKVVMTQPAIKSGLRFSAPMSEMNLPVVSQRPKARAKETDAMVWPGSSDANSGKPCVAQLMNMPNSIPNRQPVNWNADGAAHPAILPLR